MVWLEHKTILQNCNIEKHRVELDANITSHRYQLATYVDNLKIMEESTTT